MTATTPNLATFTVKEFTDSVQRVWDEQLKQVESNARQLFKVEMIGQNQGTEKIYAEYDKQTFARAKNEGQNVAKVQSGVGYEKTLRLKRFGAEIDVTEEEIKYNKYQKVMTDIKNLSGFVTRRQEKDLTSIFTFCTATSYVNMDGQTVNIATGDGVALVSASHLTAFSGVGYSNVITGNPVFSESNLEVAELVGTTQVVNNYGEQRTIDFNTIVTSNYPAVVNLVSRVLQSNAQISAPNAEVVNVYRSKYKHVILPYLARTATDAYDSAKKNYWGLVAAGTWNGHLAIWEEENLRMPTPTNNLMDGHADVMSFGVRGGYDIGVLSGQGVLWSANAS